MIKKTFLLFVLSYLLGIGFLFHSTGCDDGWRPEDVCDGPAAHIPDWIENPTGMIHVGDSVKYTYWGQDELGNDFGIFWEFEKGVPAWSKDEVVWVKYYYAGCWDVKLTMKPRCKDADQPFRRKSPGVCVLE
ncbi:MAG: hypothetical protein IPH84_19870 [Bacteroidales bacterium]|nr:hypothetical protein [Bacteroidales bacterium]